MTRPDSRLTTDLVSVEKDRSRIVSLTEVCLNQLKYAHTEERVCPTFMDPVMKR